MMYVTNQTKLNDTNQRGGYNEKGNTCSDKLEAG